MSIVVGTVYYWVNKVNNKVYIGSTSSPGTRFYHHVLESTSTELRNDFLKYGIDNFSFGVFEFITFQFGELKVNIRKKLFSREQFYIDTYLRDGNQLGQFSYNTNVFAKGFGKVVSDETRAKMSISARKKVFTEAHKENIRQAVILRHETEVNPMKGKPMSPKAREALSKSLQGHKKAVLKYDKDGNFIDQYECMSDAAKANSLLASNISKCASGKNYTYGGFMWRLRVGEIEQKIDVDRPPKVIAFDLSMKEVGRFVNAFAASKELNVHHAQISRAITSGRATVGYYFEREKTCETQQ